MEFKVNTLKSDIDFLLRVFTNERLEQFDKMDEKMELME